MLIEQRRAAAKRDQPLVVVARSKHTQERDIHVQQQQEEEQAHQPLRPIPKLSKYLYPLPSAAESFDATDSSPTSVIRDRTSSHSYRHSSSGSRECRPSSDLLPQKFHDHKDLFTKWDAESRKIPIKPQAPVLRDYPNEYPSRGVMLEKSRYTTDQEAAVQSRWFGDFETKKEGCSGVDSSVPMITKPAALAGSSPHHAYTNHSSKGLTNVQAGSNHQRGVQAMADYNQVMMRSSAHANQNGSRVAPRSSFIETVSESANWRGTADYAKPKSFVVHETQSGQGGRVLNRAAAGAVAMDRSQVNHHHHSYSKKSGYDSGSASSVGMEAPSYGGGSASSAGLLKGMQFSGAMEPRPPSPGTMEGSNKYNRPLPPPHSPDTQREVVKIVSVKAPICSKWDDAEKWITSTSPPGLIVSNVQSSSSVASGNGCRGFGNTLRLFGKTCNAGDEQAQQHRDGEHYSNKIHAHRFDLEFAGGSGHGQANKNAHQKHSRDVGVHHHHREEPQMSYSKHHPNSSVQNGMHQSWGGRTSVPAGMHPAQAQAQAQGARALPSDAIEWNDAAAAATLIDRRKLGSSHPPAASYLDDNPTTVVVQASHRCAECGTTTATVLSSSPKTDRFADQRFVSLRQHHGDSGAPIRGSSAPGCSPIHHPSSRSSQIAIGLRSDDAGASAAAAMAVSLISLRDVGTQMTPTESSSKDPSKCPTPRKNGSSPARHNTPARPSRAPNHAAARLDLVELANCHRAKMELQGLSPGEQLYSFRRSNRSNWSSREAEEEEIGKSLRHLDLEDMKLDSIVEPRSRDAAERSKSVARFQREEAKIQAWENHKKAKADAELRKLEAQLEKRRSETSGRILSKLEAVQRQAQDMRAAVRARQEGCLNGSTTRGSARLERMLRTGQICGCFTCSS